MESAFGIDHGEISKGLPSFYKAPKGVGHSRQVKAIMRTKKKYEKGEASRGDIQLHGRLTSHNAGRALAGIEHNIKRGRIKSIDASPEINQLRQVAAGARQDKKAPAIAYARQRTS